MEEIQERVLAQLDKDELVAMVRDLVSIPSPTGSEAEVADLPGGPVLGTRPAGADAGGRSYLSPARGHRYRKLPAGAAERPSGNPARPQG